jgi:hypothetical protein
MKTNDILGGLIMLIVVVFVLFLVKNIFGGIVSEFKKVRTAPAAQTTTTTTQTSAQTDSSRCPQVIVNAVLVKNSKQYDTSVGMYGKLQGGIYGILRCINGSISEAYSDPVMVGVFPLLAGKDLSNGVMKQPTAPLYMGNCTGALPTCYSIQNIPPGTYSVLVDRGQGWYCDSGVCKVDIDSAMTTTFDMITDNR